MLFHHYLLILATLILDPLGIIPSTYGQYIPPGPVVVNTLAPWVYCHKAISRPAALPDWVPDYHPFNFNRWVYAGYQHSLESCDLRFAVCGVLECNFGPGKVYIHHCLWSHIPLSYRCRVYTFCNQALCNLPTLFVVDTLKPPPIVQQQSPPPSMAPFTPPPDVSLPPPPPKGGSSRFGFMDMRDKQKKIDEFMDWKKN